jgi:hypothetical protein
LRSGSRLLLKTGARTWLSPRERFPLKLFGPQSAKAFAVRAKVIGAEMMKRFRSAVDD